MHVRKLIHSLVCVLNFILPACIPNFAEVDHIMWKVEQGCCKPQQARYAQSCSGVHSAVQYGHREFNKKLHITHRVSDTHMTQTCMCIGFVFTAACCQCTHICFVSNLKDINL